MCSQKAISSRFECQFGIYAQLTIFLLLQVLSIKGLGSLSFAKSILCNEMFGSTLHANQSFKMRGLMGWCLLRLSAKILALLRLSVNFFQLRLTKKLKINFFCFKKSNIN